VANGLRGDFLSPQSTEGLNEALQPSTTPVAIVFTGINYCIAGFITLGIVVSLLRRDRFHFTAEYMALSIAFFMLLGSTFVLPFTRLAVGTDRVYGIAILLLSPFCVIGALTFFGFIGSSITKKSPFPVRFDAKQVAIKALAVFFAIYLFFSIGFIQQLVGEPTSIALSPSVIDTRPNWSGQEVVAADWLASTKASNIDVHADFFNSFLTLMRMGKFFTLEEYQAPHNQTQLLYADPQNPAHVFNISAPGYFFFGSENVKNGTFTVTFSDPLRFRVDYATVPLHGSALGAVLSNSSTIYDSGDARVYYVT
jgi:uncharacterized membrane protein